MSDETTDTKGAAGSAARPAKVGAAATVLSILTVVGFAASVSAGDDGGGGIEPLDDNEGWFHYVDYFVGDADEERVAESEGLYDADEVRDRLLDDLWSADDRIDAAIGQLDDDELQQALVAAADRGVEVRMVADEHYEHSGQFDPFIDHSEISIEFGDGELAYLPEPNLSPILSWCDAAHTDHDDHINCTEDFGGLPQNADRIMTRPSHYNEMSHSFFLIDDTYVWNVAAPMNDDQRVWPAFRAMSEELTNSFEREFRQMHGGVFATTLSVYNGPLKSITHQQPLRNTNRGHLRVRFNPQERLVKNVIDETYRARASVFVMTENLTNEDLLAALQYKAEHDFDVKVLVGQGQAPTLMDELDELNAVQAPEHMGRLPSMVLINSEPDRNGDRQPRTVQILSHELWRAEPFQVFHSVSEDGSPVSNAASDVVRFYPSDTFVDGVMWEIVESAGAAGSYQENPEVDPFVELWEQMWAEANDE